MFGRTILIQATFFGLVGETVGKGLLYRAGDAFLRSSLVGMVAKITGFRGKAPVEFVIEAQQAVVAVLDRDETWHALEQVLVLIALLVQLLLTRSDVIGHLVDCRCQLAQFVLLYRPEPCWCNSPGQ
jgi:hypothetical protein